MANDPFNFLEDSLKKIINVFDNEIVAKTKYFDTSLIDKLEKDCKEALLWCEGIDNDVSVLNRLKNIAQKKEYNSARLFLLSDLIVSFNKLQAKEDGRARFVLAYYYDVLKNQTFGNMEHTFTWNKLVEQADFVGHLQNIRKNEIVENLKSNGLFIMPNILKSSIIHLELFIQNAFNLNFKDEQNRNDFFELNIKLEVTSNSQKIVQKEDSLEIVLGELDELIGLDNVKKDVKNLINLLEIQKKRELSGLKNAEFSLHAVFLGPPGTGKTTIARLLSRIYKQIGLLDIGQLYETDREGLVAGYMGQTATKVNTVVQESIGGVLFIDEAYSLTQNSFGNDYGSEAVNALLKRMEDNRNELAVVVAGYSGPMKEFIESNPGLRSRFSRYFFFEHFTPEQMLSIFQLFCKKSNFEPSPEAKEKLLDTFEMLYERKDDSFGNARVVRNIFEKCIQNQANRLVGLKKLSKTLLKKLEESDVPDPKETVNQVFVTVS